MTFLNYSEATLKKLDAFWTAKEIEQQPQMWKQVLDIIGSHESQLKDFLHDVLSNNQTRIILTGAGTSAFIGEILAPLLTANSSRRAEAIATTDLISAPYDYFQKDTPTLLISFARSGNSPESTAAITYADEIVDDCIHLIFTCNENGELYQNCRSKRCYAVLMPKETNDVSFAMTSSFSCMLLSALTTFFPNEKAKTIISRIGNSTQRMLAECDLALRAIANKSFERVVFLGSGLFKGLAQESALKLLELTDGKAVSMFDSPLGFRHGPKAIINDKTLVIVFVSNHVYTRNYDLELLDELQKDNEVGQLLAISANNISSLRQSELIKLEGLEDIEDKYLLFPFIACAQAYAFHHALAVKNSPDNPSASGTVNRVVQGVKIHQLTSS